MSREAIAEVYAFSRATKNARIVLLALADCAHKDTSEAWPSVATMASRTKLGERTVQRNLRKLEALREIEPVTFGGGQRNPTRYRVVPRQGATQQTLDGMSEPRQPGSSNGASRGLGTPPAGVGNPASSGTQSRRNQKKKNTPRPPSRGSAQELLDESREQLGEKLGEVTVHTWLHPLEPVSLEDDTLTLTGPEHVLTWIRERFVGPLTNAATEAAGRPIAVVVPETDAERETRVIDEGGQKRRFDRAAKRLAS